MPEDIIFTIAGTVKTDLEQDLIEAMIDTNLFKVSH